MFYNELRDLEDKLNIELKVDTANGTYTWHTDTKERVLFFFSPYTYLDYISNFY